MSWSQFVRHNRWQKLTAFLLAVLIWATVARKIRQGGAVRLTLDGSSRVFEGIPVRLLSPPGVATLCQVSPPAVAVTLRGDPGRLNRLGTEEIHVLANLEAAPGQAISARLQVFAPGFEVLEVSPKEVLIAPSSTTNKNP